jgi:DNA-binding NarL/FixJ family response regulator
MKNTVANILVVDDHPVVRKGLADLINREDDLCVTGEADTAGDALKLLDSLKPDLITVDISLNETDGIELIKQIKATESDLPILVISMHDDRIYAERALHAGAMGYVNKNEATDHLIGAIRQVLCGKTYVSEKITERIITRARNNGNVNESPIESLTDKELEVLLRLGNGQTTREIADNLKRSIKTIETHRESIKTKLGVTTSAELIHRATLLVRELG